VSFENPEASFSANYENKALDLNLSSKDVKVTIK
jgi:hypothetical protein